MIGRRSLLAGLGAFAVASARAQAPDPLADRFGLKLVVMTSLQAVSGAGRSPGVAALDVVDNVVPYIPKEEEKVQAEARKIELENDRLQVEKRAQATPSRIERLARTQLQMRNATPSITQYVQYGGNAPADGAGGKP